MNQKNPPGPPTHKTGTGFAGAKLSEIASTAFALLTALRMTLGQRG